MKPGPSGRSGKRNILNSFYISSVFTFYSPDFQNLNFKNATGFWIIPPIRFIACWRLELTSTMSFFHDTERNGSFSLITLVLNTGRLEIGAPPRSVAFVFHVLALKHVKENNKIRKLSMALSPKRLNVLLWRLYLVDHLFNRLQTHFLFLSGSITIFIVTICIQGTMRHLRKTSPELNIYHTRVALLQVFIYFLVV